MTNTVAEKILFWFTPEGFTTLMGSLLLLLIGLYLVFAFIMIRQVTIKNKSFTTPFAPFFTTVSWIHFIVTALVLLISWVVL